MTRTLKEIFDGRIDAYRNVDDPNSKEFHTIQFDMCRFGDDGIELIDTIVRMCESDFDEAPTEIPEHKWNELPEDGWMSFR